MGSHVLRALLKAGHYAVVLDNLSTGYRQAVAIAASGAAAGTAAETTAGASPDASPDARPVELIIGNVGDRNLVSQVLREHGIDAVVHCAAASLVGESMHNPSKYWHNNVVEAAELLDAMVAAGVNRIVFSSTAAIYGEPKSVPIDEDHPKDPTSTYGMTKLAIEHMLTGYAVAHGISSISLRYFNAAGADDAGDLGEAHDPETHLIPIILATALGQRSALKVFGTDYETHDGTCIRDYVHVNDLADAHLLALAQLQADATDAAATTAATPATPATPARAVAYNLGSGTGFSVREVVSAAESVVGQTIAAIDDGRRPGDPAVLVASCERAMAELGWVPQRTGLDEIIGSAWTWHRTHPNGY